MSGVPEHIAIIMDGNGRWANARGLPRTAGHRKGVEALREAVHNAGDFGVKTLTLFSFSSENWSRPRSEVGELMGLLKTFIRRDLADLHKAGVRVSIIGGRENLPADIAPLLEEAERLTCNNNHTRLVIAFNYGSRDEITRAVKSIAARVERGEIRAEEVDQEMVSDALDTADWRDPDLIIRTSGEQRLSNFLLWQSAYSELIFLDCLWPDFDRTAFQEAISVYQSRSRRFGGLENRVAQ